MQIKVSLTDKEIANLKACLDACSDAPPSWMAKMGKALNTQPKLTKVVKGLWAAIGRAELKSQFVSLAFGYWRLAEGTVASTEPCAHCQKPLGCARVTGVSKYGDDPRLAHLACAVPFWKANSPFFNPTDYSPGLTPIADMTYVSKEAVLKSYTEEETANTAAMARSLAKAA